MRIIFSIFDSRFFSFFFLFEKIKSNSYNRIDVTIKITLNKINLFERRKKRLTNLFDNCDFNESLHIQSIIIRVIYLSTRDIFKYHKGIDREMIRLKIKNIFNKEIGINYVTWMWMFLFCYAELAIDSDGQN